MNGWGNKSNWYSNFFTPRQEEPWRPSFPMTIPGQRAEPYTFMPRRETLFPTVEPRPQWRPSLPTVQKPTTLPEEVTTVAAPTTTTAGPAPTVTEPATAPDGGLFDIVSWEEWYERRGVIAYGISLEEYVRTAKEFMAYKFGPKYLNVQLSAEEMVQMRMDFFGPRGLDWRLWSRILGLGGWQNPEPGDPRYDENGQLR